MQLHVSPFSPSLFLQETTPWSRIPWLFWIILAYFMMDNVWGWMHNPYMLFFFVILAGLYGLISKLGCYSQKLLYLS